MVKYASAFIHKDFKFRDAVGGTSYLSFTNTRGPAGSKISIPMMWFKTLLFNTEFIHDAPFNDEIVIAIGGASKEHTQELVIVIKI